MEHMEIELVRGTRRRKHVEAVLVGDRLRVSFPRWVSLDGVRESAHELAPLTPRAPALAAEGPAARMRRRFDPSHIAGTSRARGLAPESHLPRPRAVRWSDQ